jgi:HEAT repeat protein
VQLEACEAAVALVRRDPELNAELVALLRAAPPHVRFAAAWVLFRARRPNLRLLPALLGSLELEDGDRRWEAAQMLVQLGRIDASVTTVLQHEVGQASAPERRRMAIFALRELAPEDARTRSALLLALEDSDGAVQRASLASLVKLDDPDGECLSRALAILNGAGDLRTRQLASAVATQLLERHPDAHARVRSALEAAASGPESLARAARLALARL